MLAGQTAGDLNGTALEWADAPSDRVVSPDTSVSLLRRAAARAPDNASIRSDLGLVLLERFELAEAAAAFAAALRIALYPSRPIPLHSVPLGPRLLLPVLAHFMGG